MNLHIVLSQLYEKMVDASIQRLGYSSNSNFIYEVTAADLNRQRLHPEIISQVIGFFNMANVGVEYCEMRKAFNIHLDIYNCMLNPTQAEGMSIAQQHSQI